MSEMQVNKGRLLLTVPLMVAALAIGILLVREVIPEDTTVTGVTETTTIDVASKIAGRVESLLVHEGDTVKKGQVVATLISREMDAKLEQARALMDTASARRLMAINGTRPKEKEAAYKLYLQAKSQYDLLGKTWERISRLYEQNVVSMQERDQVFAQYTAAQNNMDAAKARYDLALEGARPEDVSAADSAYRQAANAYKEALAYHDELKLTSPIDGEVMKRIVRSGEIAAAGYPVITLVDLSDVWIVLQLREDRLPAVSMGKSLKGRVPALGNKEYDFKVSYIAPMADFATWRPTNQKGDFDLKTFEIHLRPSGGIQGLRAGMSVNVMVE